MQKKHDTIKKQSLLYTPVGIGFLALLLLYVAYSTYGVFTKWQDAHAKYVESATNNSATVLRYNAISKDLHSISTERGKEEVIREKFDVVKDGEGVVVLPSTGDPRDNGAALAVSSQKKSFWQVLKGIFTKEGK